MNNRQRKILATVFKNPVPRNLAWNDLVYLLKNIGCAVIEGDGSRIGFELGSHRLDLHRPHPGKEAKTYQIRNVREFLRLAGVEP